MHRLRKHSSLASGYPYDVCRVLVERIADKHISPREIAISWAQARQEIMGNPQTVPYSLYKLLLGLQGAIVMWELIQDKRMAKQAINHLFSAYKETANQT